MRLFTPIVFLISMSMPLAANETNELQELMVISKATGACGVMFEMAEFQKKTQIEGGAVFVARFWKTEVARLGKTVDQMVSECRAAIQTYEMYMKEFEEL